MGSMMNPEQIARNCQRAFEKKNRWTAVLKEAYALASAGRNPYDGNKGGPNSMAEQYDGTAPVAVFRSTGRLVQGLVPPDQLWFTVAIGPLMMMKIHDDQGTIDQLNTFLSLYVQVAEMIFSTGNFINAIWETFWDLLVSGIGALLTMESPQDDNEPVIFETVPQDQIAIIDDGRGREKEVYRQRKEFPIADIVDTWADAVLTTDLQQQLQDSRGGKNDPKTCLIEVSYRNGKKWIYELHSATSEGKNPNRLLRREYTSSPWTIFRWSRLPGQEYGPGPVLLQIANIRTLNQVKKMILVNAALALAGMYMVRDDGVVNVDNIQITQGGMITVASTGGTMGPSIMPLGTNREFTLAQIIINDLQNQIRAGLFDEALPPPEQGARSPTEIIQRMQSLTQDIGGAMGRLTRTLVNMVERVFDILVSRGLVPPIVIDGYTFKVEIKSPLARAQQLQEVQTVVQWVEIARQLAGEEVTMLEADIEKIVRWVAMQMGIDQQLLRSNDDKQALQQSVAQIIAAQQMQAAPQPAGGAAPALQMQS